MLTPGAPAPTAGRPKLWIAIAVAAALLIGGAVTVALLLRGPDVAAVPQVIVTLEPVAESGKDPFAATKTINPVKAVSDSAMSVATVSAASMTHDETTGTLSTAGTMHNLYAGLQGQSTELYGGSGDLAECDVPKLAEFLAANPDKAKAWAEVRGIAPEHIADYLRTLTPVILLQDTLVTNYGYSDGVATPRQAVLQAGTGVLVDSTGQPVVRCACGNPLTAPAAINLPTAQLEGARWQTFNPAQAVVVTAAPAVADLVLVDATTGQSYSQPVAAGSADTTTASPSASATPSASSSPASSSAAPGADCAFQTQYPGSEAAWVQADVDAGPGDRGQPVDGASQGPVSTEPGSGFSCPEMIAKWRTYEQWTGERGGQWQLVDFPDGSYCGSEFVPAAQVGTATDNGAIGWCQNADQVRFVVWRGELGQHLTSGGTEAPQNPSSADSADSTVPQTSTGPAATAGTVTGAPAAGVPQDSLLTPSGNIKCAIIGGHFTCTIQDYDFPIGPCENERAPVVTLEPTGQAQLGSCIGDLFATVQPTPTVYGTVVTLGQISCDVEQTGLRCTNPEGHGFQLSRAAFSPF